MGPASVVGQDSNFGIDFAAYLKQLIVELEYHQRASDGLQELLCCPSACQSSSQLTLLGFSHLARHLRHQEGQLVVYCRNLALGRLSLLSDGFDTCCHLSSQVGLQGLMSLGDLGPCPNRFESASIRSGTEDFGW